MFTKRALSIEDARRVAAAAVAEAKKNNWNVSIAIVDDGAHLLYLERMDGAAKPSALISQEKARTAALFRRPTKAMEETLNSGRHGLLALPGVTPVEGGIPLMVDNECVGAIGASGVQSAQDAQIASAGAAALVG
ncbi:MAG TPA: heme-binding protein [Candidatus Binataceae bacterium]|nr:heme-binding protein [Candidatus Binataceae bacterium]